MRIACVGGGPAGLFFGILASQLRTGHEITVYERYPAAQTYGWGVVFWDNLLCQLDERDAPTAQAMRANAFRWAGQTIHVQGRAPTRIPGHGYGMARQTLLEILTGRARELGVDLRYGHQVRDVTELGDVDLVIASDGVGSLLRAQHGKTFGTVVDQRRNKYIWLGTSRVFESFTFPFVLTEAGWIWAHAYGFDDHTSTFIVETTPETWTALGFDQLGQNETMRRLEGLFASHLDGHSLRPQAGAGRTASWLQFQTITNERWHHDSLVLMGDAAHTTHFTIGSGTRLAMEDAMGLADALTEDHRLEVALEQYGHRRASALRPLQCSAANSARWFEEVPRYIEDERFSDLLFARRSTVMRRLGPDAYLRLADASTTVSALTRPARKVVRRLIPDHARRR
jgi:anthraniloyl-CoA monooxygenase